MDYDKHNQKVHRIWETYHAGVPEKVPVIIYYDARIWLRQPGEHRRRITLSEYIQDMDLMLQCQIKAQAYKQTYILSDELMGYPHEEGYSVMVDFQNYFEVAWLGGQVQFGEEPHARPFLNDDNKYSIFDNPPPDAFSGIGEEALIYYEYFQNKGKTYLYKGIPVKHISLPFNMTGTDGPFTIACGIRGTENFLADLIFDSDYAHRLLDYLTTAIISRIKQVRQYLELDLQPATFGMGDDAVALISPLMYKNMVLPYHARLYDELCTLDGERHMHLCGKAQHLFKSLHNDLGIMCFDTGFPIDFGVLYRQLPSSVRVNGGPNVLLLLNGDTCQVAAETQRILCSGVMEQSKSFVLRDANAICPGTPLDNINTVYQTCEQFGYYNPNHL